MRAAVIIAAALLTAAPVLSQETEVDLELILMADGSGSVDHEEFTLQRRGYAEAFRDPRIIDAIRSGPKRRIALAYVEWSGPQLQIAIIPWRIVATPEDAEEVASALESHPRMLYGGGTALGNAILFGVQAIKENGFTARRRVIDISGDGPDRNGLPASVGRDVAVDEGMTVNGLPIIDEFFPGLDTFFRKSVIGGPGAFAVPARGFRDVGTAIRLKLIREIADLGR